MICKRSTNVIWKILIRLKIGKVKWPIVIQYMNICIIYLIYMYILYGHVYLLCHFNQIDGHYR